MKTTLLLCSFLLITCFSNGQQAKVDSLKVVLETVLNKSDRLEILKEICKKASEINILEKTHVYYDELFSIAQEIDDEETMAFGYHLLLREYEKKRDSIKALEYFHKAHKINLKRKDSLGIVKDYNALGGIYNKFQQYKKAEEAYLKALDICKNNNFDYIGKVYINLGIVKQNQRDYSRSTEYALLARENAFDIKNKEQESSSLGIIAGNYMWTDNDKKAEEYYLKALDISEKEDYFLPNLNNYRGLATTYSRLGAPEKALEYNFKALDLVENYGDKLYKLDILLNIATAYNRAGSIKESYTYYDKALEIANELDSNVGKNVIRINVTLLKVNEGKYQEAEKIILKALNDTIDRNALPETHERSAYILLSMIYEGKKDYKRSLLYHKKYFSLAYDILSKSQLKNVAEFDTKYQTEKKEKENLTLKQQNAEQALLMEKEKKSKNGDWRGATNFFGRFGYLFCGLSQKPKTET